MGADAAQERRVKKGEIKSQLTENKWKNYHNKPFPLTLLYCGLPQVKHMTIMCSVYEL